MKKSVLYVFIALTLLSLCLVFVPMAHSQPSDIRIVSYSYYFDMAGFFDVVGEVQNVGPNTVTPVLLTGSAYSPDGTDISDSYTQIGIYPNPITYLSPQQYAPFYMEFASPTNTVDQSWAGLVVSSVKLTVAVANATQSYQYPDLKVTSSQGSIGTNSNGVNPDQGVYWVNGKIQNTGSQTAQNITVFGTYYNSTGNVVAVGFSNQIGSLSPSGTTSFKVGAFDLNQTGIDPTQKITKYSLQVVALDPVLQSTAPLITPGPTEAGSSTPTSNSSPTNNFPTDSQSSPSSLQPLGNSTLIAIVIIIAIIAVVGVIITVRKRKTHEAKIVVVPRKVSSKRNRKNFS